MDNKKDELYKKAKVYCNNKTPVFIKYIRTDGTTSFYTGLILEISADFFILKDKYEKEIPIFFLELEKEGTVFDFDNNIKENKKIKEEVKNGRKKDR